MPGPFHFRLEVVQRLRKADLEREQRAMAASVNAVLEAQKLADMVAQRIEENAADRRELLAGEFLNMTGLRAEQLQRQWLRRMQEQTAQELAKRHDSVEAQRQKLVAATRRVKVIEKLRDRQWKRHQDEQRRIDRRQEDEFAMILPGLAAGWE